MKKLLLAILCAALLLSGAAALAETIPQRHIGDFVCLEYEDMLEVIGYAGDDGGTELYIPASLGEKTVERWNAYMIEKHGFATKKPSGKKE